MAYSDEMKKFKSTATALVARARAVRDQCGRYTNGSEAHVCAVQADKAIDDSLDALHRLRKLYMDQSAMVKKDRW